MIAIETKNLVKKYKEKIAVNSINLSINKGELFALLGVNGAGKSTTIKMLSGLSKPTSGDAILLDKSIVTNPEEAKLSLGISPQETAVAENLSVRENLELIAQIHGFDKKTSQQKANKIIEEFKLNEVEKNRAKTLSGGMQRRLSIAMALITEPEILFLDEPTLGLDVLARRELWNNIEKLQGKVTIILTTHYMEEAESLADRIGIMADGNLIDIGTVKELTAKTNTKNLEEAFVKIVTEKNNS